MLHKVLHVFQQAKEFTKKSHFQLALVKVKDKLILANFVLAVDVSHADNVKHAYSRSTLANTTSPKHTQCIYLLIYSVDTLSVHNSKVSLKCTQDIAIETLYSYRNTL